MATDRRAELWLIRHGETEWSASGKHTSRTDVSLTEKGRERAAELGRYLAQTEFCAVFRSPMARARETCEIAGFGDRAIVDPDLCEWDYGVYEGRTTREIQAELPGWSVWKDAIVGGESLEQVGARADRMIAKALAAAAARSIGSGSLPDHITSRDELDALMIAINTHGIDLLSGETSAPARVALFGHAHILRILAARWVGLPPSGGAVLALSTGSLSVLGWERETRVIQLWNRGFEE